MEKKFDIIYIFLLILYVYFKVMKIYQAQSKQYLYGSKWTTTNGTRIDPHESLFDPPRRVYLFSLIILWDTMRTSV